MTTQQPSLEETNLDDLRKLSERELIRLAFETHGPRAAIGTSGQKTGVVMIDIAAKLGMDFRVFFVDTEKNHPETYELFDEIEQRYGIEVERFKPEPQDVENLQQQFGSTPWYFSRQSCCHVRKVLPLQRALQTLDVWLSGLRADQSEHRADNAQKATWAKARDGRKILKINPMLEWTDEQIDQYIRENDVPCNKLYDYESQYGEKYKVIGCVPCHIPVKEGLVKRFGKWPWESGGKKECGLHSGGSGI
ncbi:MAG: phosphoadenylyl-sulfate reductase [Planctomycetota bacterium]